MFFDGTYRYEKTLNYALQAQKSFFFLQRRCENWTLGDVKVVFLSPVTRNECTFHHSFRTVDLNKNPALIKLPSNTSNHTVIFVPSWVQFSRLTPHLLTCCMNYYLNDSWQLKFHIFANNFLSDLAIFLFVYLLIHKYPPIRKFVYDFTFISTWGTVKSFNYDRVQTAVFWYTPPQMYALRRNHWDWLIDGIFWKQYTHEKLD